MNAILDEECEAPVLTNEAIEVHLSYLRPAVEAIQAELPVLQERIEALDEKLTGKSEALDHRLTDKIEALDQKLSDKIEAVDQRLSGKIDALDKELKAANKEHSDRFVKIQASQDGLKWFIGSLALIVSGISIARTLGWI
jgi:chromosome segregation ATPase